jgi:hypothetical protein
VCGEVALVFYQLGEDDEGREDDIREGRCRGGFLEAVLENPREAVKVLLGSREEPSNLWESIAQFVPECRQSSKCILDPGPMTARIDIVAEPC